jgi:hypothetical protein
MTQTVHFNEIFTTDADAMTAPPGHRWIEKDLIEQKLQLCRYVQREPAFEQRVEKVFLICTWKH